ncbi:carboxypeptidase regulatory-like domain-containing protein [Amycolatopsis rhabdoformis]|uniref:Carboxypeptidase regulatory-like domain-containing protein n=1 Tax=Amycolatopsis rhabdoformis TaxID=1448059 RepID=A0ABZ1HWL7_9PSEU|nr:carboxypeptidase regulatory-like domain-containing protein [Amycolatopsis rhabdoformis]WSE26617.1 carboxypeptidase regulatory-like domain-containing protein [Amycolatopsis rhabdoformis]
MAEQPLETAQPRLVRTLAENLWFPVVVFLGFAVVYLAAFHHPRPHDVQVAVIGPAAEVQHALDKAAPGGFHVVPVPDVAAARDAILDRAVSGAFAADPAHPVLYVARANGFTLQSLLTQTFTPLAHSLSVVDLAPTVAGDPLGNGLFYLLLAWSLPSYFVVMMLLRAVGLSRRARILTFVGWAVFLSVAGFLIAHAMDVIPADPVAIPLAFLASLVVSLVSQGLVPIFKQYFPGVAMMTFVILSSASSGGTVPPQMQPGFFRFLHPILPMGNLNDALRGVFYFHGTGVAEHVLVLCAWLALGIVLNAGHALWLRRQVTRETAPPVEDPVIEMPRPTALPATGRRFGELEPMLVGTVRSTSGERVGGAIVTVTDGKGRQLVRTTADGEGAFAVGGLPEQFVDVVVTAPGRQPAARRTFFREGVFRREDFVLAPEPVLTPSSHRPQ